MEILAKLFGSPAKVKLMRLFLFNPETTFTLKDLKTRTRLQGSAVNKELGALVKLGLIKKAHTKKPSFGIDQRFPYLSALKNLLITVSLHADASLAKKFANAGRIKLFLASGVFLQEWDARVDLLIVGDGLNMARVVKIISEIEAEIGKEISYSAFETEDFQYRLGIHDRLIRDIIDCPHATIVDKLGVV
jgi:hypothetical protein